MIAAINTCLNMEDKADLSSEEPKLCPLRVYKVLEEAQNSYGVPHQDYRNYQAYCTKRLSRIRHHETTKSILVHSSKYVEIGSGSGKRRHGFCPRNETSPEFSPDNVDVYWNLLFQAERAWAQACGYQKAQKSHKFVQRRLNKAAKWAKAFSDLVEKTRSSSTDDDDVVAVHEARSYADWMAGNAALEHKDYKTAHDHYALSMKSLENLANNHANMNDLELRDVWTTRAESVLRPLVRYCQYEAGIKEDAIMTTEPDEYTKRGTMKEIDKELSILLRFRNQEIYLDAEYYKEIAVMYLKMEESLKNPGALDESHYLTLLSDLDDSMKVVNQEISKYDASKAGPAVKARIQELQTISSYFEFQKRSIWRQQQERLVPTYTDPAELLHVYDALLQNAKVMADIPVDEEDAFWLEAQAHVLRIRAFRCYYISLLYEKIGTKEAHSLLLTAQNIAQAAKEEIGACDMLDVDHYLQELDELTLKIQASKCRVEATLYLEDKGVKLYVKTDRPLWMRLEDYDCGQVLADDPLLPIPIPMKPFFFDIAGQYLASELFPTEEIEDYVATQEPKSQSLFSKWFGS